MRVLQKKHRRTDGFHALARPPRRFKFLDCLINADPYSVYNFLGVVLVPPMSWSVSDVVVVVRNRRPWVRVILRKFELMQSENLCMIIEDNKPRGTKVRFSWATWRFKKPGDRRCSAIEGTDELRMLEHMLRLRMCGGC